MYSPRTIEKMNAIGERYVDLILRAIQDVLKDAKYRNTGKTAESVQVEMVAGAADKSPVIRIELDEALLIIDKRKLQWTKLPNMKALLEWAATKESDPKKAKRLAFATAYTKLKYDKWKAKSWRKKSLSAVLKELNVQVLAEFDKAIEEDLVAAAA
jgi:hypothetical protein